MSTPRTSEPLYTTTVNMYRRQPKVPVISRQAEFVPSRKHESDAGGDLRNSTSSFVLAPGERRLVKTGVLMAIPSGYVGLICPRSGLANEHGITVANAPGIIDAGYTGEICVNLVNHGQKPVEITYGMRVAQIVITPVAYPQWEEVSELPNTERGTAGHGSTGTE